MKVSYEKLSRTIKKLPVGYYIGKNVDVKLSKNYNNSFYNLNNQTITISYSQISDALNKLEDESLYEEVVRSNFYHELGHAMLTPCINKFVKFDSILNVFEDERIERKLDDYFLGVNFKRNVELLNSKSGSYSDFSKFFDLVRFRIGPDKFLNRVETLLNKYSELNSVSSRSDFYQYDRDVHSLYNDFTGNPNSSNSDTDSCSRDNDNNSSGNSCDSSEDSINSDSSDDFSSEDSDNENFNTVSNGSSSCSSDDEGDEGVRTSSEISDSEEGFRRNKNLDLSNFSERNQEILEEFESIVNSSSEDIKLTSELLQIFNSANKVHKLSGSALNSYSGVFDPRSVVREDYKYFLVKGRGDKRKFSKINLNLFIDRSGSMSLNEKYVNSLICSLVKVKKLNSNFDFNIITLGDSGQTIEDLNTFVYTAYDGTRIYKELYRLYKKVQNPDFENYNIVLFDGYCYGEENFGAFNNKNVIIVADDSNSDNIKKYAPSSRKVFISNNYATCFIGEVVKLLRSVVR